jgi:hypothetical protein
VARFFLKIDGDNDAFGTTEAEAAQEVGKILKETAAKLAAGRTSGKVHDLNGNRVGEFRLDCEEGEPCDSV